MASYPTFSLICCPRAISGHCQKSSLTRRHPLAHFQKNPFQVFSFNLFESFQYFNINGTARRMFSMKSSQSTYPWQEIPFFDDLASVPTKRIILTPLKTSYFILESRRRTDSHVEKIKHAGPEVALTSCQDSMSLRGMVRATRHFTSGADQHSERAVYHIYEKKTERRKDYEAFWQGTKICWNVSIPVPSVPALRGHLDLRTTSYKTPV